MKVAQTYKVARQDMSSGKHALNKAHMSDKDKMADNSEWDKSAKMTTDEASPYDDVMSADTIVVVAAADPDVSVFADLVREAGLIDALNGEDPVTVFAPTNEAFAKLDKDELIDLRNDKDRLVQVLKSHIVPGRITVADVPEMGAEYDTMANTVIQLKRDDLGAFSASDVAVSRMDIMASNGVIHVIDNVIMPEYPEGSILNPAVGS